MIARLHRLLAHQLANRVLAIAVGVLMVANLAALGPAGTTKTPDASDPGSLVNESPGAGTTQPTITPTGVASNVPGVTGSNPTIGGGPTIKGTTKPTIPPSDVPHFGLLTQGITATTVRIGVSENFSNCGDAASLAAANPAVVGDVSKAIDTFTDYVNATGGVGGKRLVVSKVDDGGTCSSKNIAAAKKMLEEDKVFMAIPGLDVESNWLIDRHLPVFGGAADDTSIARYGPNGLMLTEPAGATFDAWASFGKYRLDTAHHTPCLIRIATGAAGNFDVLETMLKAKMTKYGLRFAKVIVFPDDPSRAQEIAENVVDQAKAAHCDEAWFMAGNAVGLVFVTDAATRKQWFPHAWTFNSLTYLSDDDVGGNLMDKVQWANAYGLTYRVPDGKHPKSGNCQKIYEQRNGADGQSMSAAVKIACAKMLTAVEMMRRAIALTGVLNADTLLLGADNINDDFYYDATVPLDYKFPSASGPFKTRAFSHYTTVKWDGGSQKYTFPDYPCYYRTFGANNGGCENLEASFQKAK
jgi:hypothetical protein